MPVKRRLSKRKLSTAAELAAWSELFTTGYDFFDDLEPFGFPHIHDADRAARAAAPEAWSRLGETFMMTWEPDPRVREEPWALEEFGKPWEARRAR